MEEPQNPITALFRSFLIPGLGQYYNGEKKKAALVFAAAVALFFSFWVLLESTKGVTGAIEGPPAIYLIPGAFLVALWVFNVIDAHIQASLQSQKEPQGWVVTAGLAVVAFTWTINAISSTSSMQLTIASILAIFGGIFFVLMVTGGITEKGVAKRIWVFLGVLVILSLLWGGLLLETLDNGKYGQSIQTMRYELKNIVAAGYGVSSSKQVEFSKDEYIHVKNVVGDTPILEKQVHFICGSQSPELCSGSDTALILNDSEGDASITVNKNTKAYVAVCGDDSKDKYCISIGRQGSDARETCSRKCLQ